MNGAKSSKIREKSAQKDRPTVSAGEPRSRLGGLRDSR
nr:MAG TPA: hypothetical protein [Caudoviricetes sp.]